MLTEMLPTYSTIALYTPPTMQDGFTPAPVCLSEVDDFGVGRSYVVTMGHSILGRSKRWDIKPQVTSSLWWQDHSWTSLNEAKIRADLAIKAYKSAIEEMYGQSSLPILLSQENVA